MTFLDPTRDFQAPSLKGAKLEGWVIDVDDPDKRQRVRLRVPVLHRGIPDDKLPWGHINAAGGSAQAGAGVGSVGVPDKYAKVEVSYEEDDPHNPRFGPSPTTDDVHKDNELLTMDYPNTVGHTDSHGNMFIVNKATGDVTTVHKSGAVVNIDSGGNLNYSTPGNVNLGAAGDVNIGAGGNVNIGSGGNVNVNGSQVHLNSGSAASPTIGGARSTPQIESKAGQVDM